MAEEKMSLIEELQNPPRVDGGGLASITNDGRAALANTSGDRN